MRTEKFTLPKKPAIQVLGRTRAHCHALSGRAIILRHRATGYGVDKLPLCRRCLMRLRRGHTAGGVEIRGTGIEGQC